GRRPAAQSARVCPRAGPPDQARLPRRRLTCPLPIMPRHVETLPGPGLFISHHLHRKDTDMWVELTIPVPPLLTELCGYPGDARYVSLCWQPCGDECEYDDGRTSGTGSWGPYLAYTRHPAVAPALVPYDLGSSDARPKHLLLIDRAEQKAFVA